MKYSNLFLLSFLSTNMKTLIKSSQIMRFKNIIRLMYQSDIGDKRIASILFKTKNVMGEDTLGMGDIMGIFDHHMESKNDCFQLNVSGEMIDFRLSNQRNLPEACFHPSERESAIESIHNYFLDFFGDTMDYIWGANNPEHFIPNLPNLSVWVTSWPESSEAIDMKSLEKFFASSPVLKHLHIKLTTKEVLSPESKFYQVESIKIVQPLPKTVNALLRHFQGRQATLFFCEIEVLPLIEFMNRWISGEAFQKLEYLKIILLSNDIALNEVLNVNGLKHIDATKTPPAHTVANVYTPTLKQNTDPIITHTYVVRKTDNRVASVSIQEGDFVFGVWNETEEEFLTMVK
ncbi:Protein CBG17464 [Caenorhabditis briggsae]|uniref:Protein CBG17464 n=1 Tax=Caenorhabditis briggsae TaxID=6238 RepID=A8XR50_CAEBR|nr:Protein CBG17464 [Caenorhabditis briggsae]CAP35123.2 Protein CBG17464 [Caenorhabditis briggsae]